MGRADFELANLELIQRNSTEETKIVWQTRVPQKVDPASIARFRSAVRGEYADTKLLIYGLFQKGRVLAQDGVGSCRRELLEHVVVLGACHLIRLVRAYISYYHEDRCHLGLNKDTPSLRAVTRRPSPTAKVVALPRVGGLHHRYEWREAA